MTNVRACIKHLPRTIDDVYIITVFAPEMISGHTQNT